MYSYCFLPSNNIPDYNSWNPELSANETLLGRPLTSNDLYKQRLDVFEAKIEKAGSHQESNSGHLACAASALPLSYDNWTTTNPHNPPYVLHRWYWSASVSHLAGTQYVPSEPDQKILSTKREPILSGFLSLNA